VELESVSLWYWHEDAGLRIPVLDDLSLTVGRGERWALLGPNGAGKTTLLGVIGARAFPSSGAATILGSRLGRVDVGRLREQIGHVDARDAHRFAPNLTVEEVVRTGATGTIGLFSGRLTQGDLERARDLVATFGLGRVARRGLRDCSQGERARTLIARALLGRPRLLLLDEPAAGVDLPGREVMLTTLDRAIQDEPTLTVVLTTHHLEELPSSITHGLLLRGGRAIACGPVADALTGPALSACFGLPLDVERSGGRWTARHAVSV
jgi:iron complex transport system ATP-binding protein